MTSDAGSFFARLQAALAREPEGEVLARRVSLEPAAWQVLAALVPQPTAREAIRQGGRFETPDVLVVDGRVRLKLWPRPRGRFVGRDPQMADQRQLELARRVAASGLALCAPTPRALQDRAYWSAHVRGLGPDPTIRRARIVLGGAHSAQVCERLGCWAAEITEPTAVRPLSLVGYRPTTARVLDLAITVLKDVTREEVAAEIDWQLETLPKPAPARLAGLGLEPLDVEPWRLSTQVAVLGDADAAWGIVLRMACRLHAVAQSVWLSPALDVASVGEIRLQPPDTAWVPRRDRAAMRAQLERWGSGWGAGQRLRPRWGHPARHTPQPPQVRQLVTAAPTPPPSGPRPPLRSSPRPGSRVPRRRSPQGGPDAT